MATTQICIWGIYGISQLIEALQTAWLCRLLLLLPYFGATNETPHRIILEKFNFIERGFKLKWLKIWFISP